jgi:hypothetical protein
MNNRHIPALASAALMLFAATAFADDHLFQGQQHGLSGNTHSQAATRSLAPGQGSPMTGEETKTPATETEAANAHAQVKPRAPDDDDLMPSDD